MSINCSYISLFIYGQQMMHIKLLCTPLLMVPRLQTLVTNSSCHAFDRWLEWPRVTALIRGSSLHIPSWTSKWSEMDGVRGVEFSSVPAQRTGAAELLIQLAWVVRSVQRRGNLRWMASTVTATGWRNAAFRIFSGTMCINLRRSRGSVLVFVTQVRGFKPGRSRRIFQGEKPSARLPSEGK